MGNSLYDEFAFLGDAEPRDVKNSLYEWCINNGDRGTQILSEWDNDKNVDGHGIPMSPHEVKRGSDKIACWKCCRCGNEYELPIRRRIGYVIGCKVCRTKGFSYSEMVIFFAILAKFPKALHKYKCDNNKWEFDIAIPEINTYIEYSGEYWHDTFSKTDQVKRDYCLKNRLRFIEIIELKKSAPLSVEGDVIKYKYSDHNQDGMLYNVILELYKLLGVDDIELDYRYVLNQAIKKTLRPIHNSLLDRYPQLQNEFDEELNCGAKMEYFSVSSSKRIKWKCTNCKRIWSSTIANRTEFQSGCPYCGFNIFKGKLLKLIAKRKPHIFPGAYNL